jgi:salicylate hydroxylase
MARAVQTRAPGSITLSTRIVSAQSQGMGVVLQAADGRSFEADALIAADGVHSLLRQQCLGEDKPQFMDLLAWRGLVPIERLPEHLRRPVGTNWVGPGAHVITYPVHGGQLMNVVGIVERGDWRGESWTEPGSHEELLQDFGRWHEDVRTLMRHIDQPFKWALLGRSPQRGWAHGAICLVGDAAHPTLPFLAQGANMALEDAAVMGRCLTAVPVPAEAFARFESLRWQRTADIVNRSRDNAQRFHNPQLANDAVAVAYVDREWQPDSVRRRYDWLFEYDPLNVPL